jgi:hypothetical protein
MRRPRLTALAVLAAAATALLAGCSTGDSAESRVAVLGESMPQNTTPMLGAGDALGRGLHEVILARSAGGATYATVTDSPDLR